jgi:hypothetical protein
MLAEHERTSLAIALLRRGARLSVTRVLTKIADRRLRGLYRQINGHAPQGGPVPDAGGRMIQTRRLQAHASLYAVLFLERTGAGKRPYTQGLIEAYDRYGKLMRDSFEAPELDINSAWAITRDLRLRVAHLVYCPVCRIEYLVAEQSRVQPTCPLCSFYSRAATEELRAHPGRKKAAG